MPETLAFILFSSGAPLAVVNAVASVSTTAFTTFVISTAASVGAGLALSALSAKPQTSPSDRQIEVKQPVAPRLIHYGRRKVAGSVAFLSIPDPGDDSPELFKIVTLSAREIDAIESHYLNGQLVEWDETDGAVVSYDEDGNSWAYVYPHLGTDTQAADAVMLIEFPGIWTTAHQGKGVAYAVERLVQPNNLDTLLKVFGSGPPEYQALIRGAKLYDPTLDSTNGGSGSCRINDTSTWVWSEEQRLVMLDYLTHPDCYAKGFPAGTPIAARSLAACSIDWASWVPQILRGRELVDLKAGGTEARYRIATTVDLANEERTSAFSRIRAAGDARIFFTNEGKIGCSGGGWDVPVISLNAADHLIDAELGPIDRMAGYNVLKFKYLSPPHDYVEQDGDPWRDEAAIDAAGGVEREMEVDLTAVPSHGQARRLCKIMIARDNAAFSGAVKTKLYGLQAVREEAISFTFDELDGGSGDINGPWWIDGEISLDLETATVGMGLKKADPLSYAWTPEEEGDAPPVPGGLPDTLHYLSDDADFSLSDDADAPLLDEAA